MVNMVKLRVYAYLLVFLLFFNLPFVLAQTFYNDPIEIPNPADFISQKWDSFLEQSNIGNFFLSASKIFEALSPLFKVFIGVEYSLSWMFFLSLLLWIVICILIYKFVKVIFQNKVWISLAIAVIVTTLGTQFGALQFVLGFFNPFFTDTFNVLIFGIGILIVLFIGLLLIKVIKKQSKTDIERRREEKAKLAEKIHDSEIKVSGGGKK